MNVTASQVRDAFNAAKSLKSACDAEVAAGRYTLVGCSFVGSVGDGHSEQVPADKALARQFNDACQHLTELLDVLVANVTGFGGTFCDLLDAQRKNGYRPTFFEKGGPEVAVLADCYDYFAGLWGLAEKSYRPEAKEVVTYQKVWDDNQTETEGRDGKIRTGVVGWVYEVRVNGEYVDNFPTLRRVKQAYPQAKRRQASDWTVYASAPCRCDGPCRCYQ